MHMHFLPRSRPLMAALVALAFPCSSIRAQQRSSILDPLPTAGGSRLAPLAYAPGTMIRIHDVRGQMTAGRLITSSLDSLHLESSTGAVAIPTPEVAALDIQLTGAERRSRTLRGASVGAALGLLMGILLGNAVPVEESCTENCFLDEGGLKQMGNMGTYAVIGAVAGGVLGGVIVHQTSDGWQRVRLFRVATGPLVVPYRGAGPAAGVQLTLSR